MVEEFSRSGGRGGQNDEPDPAKQKPIRKMLSVYDFRVGRGALLELIDYMLKLK